MVYQSQSKLALAWWVMFFFKYSFAFLFFSSFVSALNPPSLFQQAWHDFSIFERDLNSSYQDLDTLLADMTIYHLDVHLSDDLATLSGQQELLFSNTTGESISDLVFRLYPNALGGNLLIKRIWIDGVVAVARLEQAATVLRVFLAKPLEPGDKTIVRMQFSTQIGDSGESYGRLGLYSESLSLAHAYPILSVFRQGGWLSDRPSALGDPIVSEAALYLVRLNAPKDQVITATGSLFEEQVVGDRHISSFSAGPVREFYIASSKGFVQLSRLAGETMVHVYVPERFSKATEPSLEFAVQALERFSKFIPYPYREFEIVAIPVLASGIEFPGVIVLTNRLFAGSMGFLESVLVHETAHQWSYNLVGSDQVLEPWLDEALVQYLTLLYHRSYGSEQDVQNYLDYWNNLWQDSSKVLAAIGKPVASYDEASYSGIVYGRGLFFFLALEELMGQDILEQALASYYQRFAWHFVNSKDLKLSLEESCLCELEEVFSTWVYRDSP